VRRTPVALLDGSPNIDELVSAISSLQDGEVVGRKGIPYVV